MNHSAFESHLITAASRNGWENCKPAEDGSGGLLLSSTAHRGLLRVLSEGDSFCIIPTYQPIRCVSLEELGTALRELVASDSPPTETERESIVSVRTVQHIYRRKLSELWGGRCPCTGVAVPELLRASHAKPWKDCTDAERIDPYNGFLLEARFDALFDSGLISFSDSGELISSPRLSDSDASRLDLSSSVRIPNLSPRHLPYLRWHRSHVFITSLPTP